VRVIVLGSAAGGGVPQWNSASEACRLARAGDPRSPARTQAGLAVSGDGASWWLLDASPDLRAQIASAPALHARGGDGGAPAVRGSPIRGVVVTGADVDKIAGLLTLREGQPLVLWATRAVLGALDVNPVFEVLDRAVVARRPLPLDEPVRLDDRLRITAFAVPGKAPRWAEDPADPTAGGAGHAVGLLVDDGSSRLAYVPGCAAVTDEVVRRVDGAGALLFDGTLWTDDEMLRLGASPKTGRRMGHVAMSGPEGAVALLAGARVGRRIFIHVNNTNPALVTGSPERRAVEAAGW
jgi:pyrroloquinoline quinone biosynthesis protein B